MDFRWICKLFGFVGSATLILAPGSIAYAGDGDIVISELGYNATCLGTDPATCGSTGTTENRFEWVEIYNQGSASVNLNSWQLCDNNGCDSLPDVDIGAGEYWVIAYNETALQTEFNQYSPQFKVDSGKTIQLNSQIGGSYGLANGGDLVYLLNASGTTVDCISWDSPATTECADKTYIAGANGFDSTLTGSENGQSITNIQGQWYYHGPSDAAQQASPYQSNTAVGGSPTAITLSTFTASTSIDSSIVLARSGLFFAVVTLALGLWGAGKSLVSQLKA